jgi:hypothetical protein
MSSKVCDTVFKQQQECIDSPQLNYQLSNQHSALEFYSQLEFDSRLGKAL